MRIYGLRSGRNKSAYYIARSYMWASRDTKRNASGRTIKLDNNLTGSETTVRVSSDFSNNSKENSELEVACSEWLKNNEITNSTLVYGILILIVGAIILAFSLSIGLTILAIGFTLSLYGGIDFSIKREVQEACKPTIEYQIEGDSIVDEAFKKGITSHKLLTYNAYTANAKAKVNSGATNIYDLKEVSFSTNEISFLNVNVPVYCFRSILWELYILPDMCIYKEGNVLHTIEFSNIKIEFSDFVIRMPDSKPIDCDVIGTTWLYVNKNGTPDGRYSNNKQVPICRLGEFSLTSINGLNIYLLASKYDAGKKVYQQLSKMMLKIEQ